MDKMLEEALRLRKLGLAVHWLRPNSKAPIAEGWAQAPVMTEGELKAAYRSGNNLGCRPGKWSIVDGKEVCVLDVDIRGGQPYAAEAYAAAVAMMGDDKFDVVTGSIVGRHRYLKFLRGTSPASAATTLRQSDIWIHEETGRVYVGKTKDARPAWLIELLVDADRKLTS